MSFHPRKKRDGGVGRRRAGGVRRERNEGGRSTKGATSEFGDPCSLLLGIVTLKNKDLGDPERKEEEKGEEGDEGRAPTKKAKDEGREEWSLEARRGQTGAISE